jgi:hypothetical protein
MGILCCRAAIELYREVVGLDGTARRIGLVCFVWGGGLAVLAALAHGAMTGERSPSISSISTILQTGGGYPILAAIS